MTERQNESESESGSDIHEPEMLEAWEDDSELRKAYKTPQGLLVQIRKGDLTQEPVDVIVNAANTRLDHGGGVAGAISRAAGPAFQAVSDNHVAIYGAVPTGQAIIQLGFGLPQKYVIHAVGPIYREDSKGKDGDLSLLGDMLYSAVQHSLALAHLKGCRSIAFCAISTGIFGFPKELCAKLFIRSIADFSLEAEDTELRLIRLTNFDDPTVTVFEEQFAEHAHKEGFEAADYQTVQGEHNA